MRVLVTGVAGFIGSHLAERLLADGHSVLGVDSFTPGYAPARKEANLASIRAHPRFRLERADLAAAPLDRLSAWLADYPYVSHQAAWAGVRGSWAESFEAYLRSNVLGTQRLLEAAKEAGVRRFVYASSSSVYGPGLPLPLLESGPARPVSPYGATKLAAEHLARAYWVNYKVPTVSLRYFTVYGPRQRPDMAFHRMIRCLLRGGAFPMYGDGSQARDFTYVADAVEANVRALFADAASAPFLGEAINVGGGRWFSLSVCAAILERLSGRRLKVERRGVQRGDVDRTGADTGRIQAWLGFIPRTPIEEGLAAQLAWQADAAARDGGRAGAKEAKP